MKCVASSSPLVSGSVGGWSFPLRNLLNDFIKCYGQLTYWGAVDWSIPVTLTVAPSPTLTLKLKVAPGVLVISVLMVPVIVSPC